MDAYEWLRKDLETALLEGSKVMLTQPLEYSRAGKDMLERAANCVLSKYGFKCEVTFDKNMNATIRPYLECCEFTEEA